MGQLEGNNIPDNVCIWMQYFDVNCCPLIFYDMKIMRK